MPRVSIDSVGTAILGVVISLLRIRRRVPLVVFILLLILLVVALGLACACATDHPSQAIERALSAIPAAPPIIVVWSFAATAFFMVAATHGRPRLAPGRASPAQLQRFLF